MAQQDPATQREDPSAECSDWGPPPAVAPSGQESLGDGEADRKSLCVAVATMLLSVPALVGSWCWPLLLAGLFSGLAHVNTPATRSFAHALTFGIDLAVFTNIVQFAVAKTWKSRSGMLFCRKWGPVFCLIAATILSMADLVRHLVNDAWEVSCTELDEGSSIQVCGSDGHCRPLEPKFDRYCFAQNVANEFSGGEGFPHLSVYGWVFTIACTWSGFLLLFVGIFWIINFPQKLRLQWRKMRAGGRRSTSVEMLAATGQGHLLGEP